MPHPISFAWTTPALLARRKTCTRRDWRPVYARGFHAGDIVAAFDRQPRFGGRAVATLRLTVDPYLQSTVDAPESDYAAEGFDYLTEIGAKVDGLSPRVLWRAWHLNPQDMWVVRFEILNLVDEDGGRDGRGD